MAPLGVPIVKKEERLVFGMLTVRQEKFCLEYAESGNARQAYLNAGYKPKSDKATDAAASRLLSNVKVQKRLAELAEELKNSKIADIQEMQEVLTKIIRRELPGVTIKDVISAIDKLGRMQGAFVEKIEASFSYEDRLREVVGLDEY